MTRRCNLNVLDVAFLILLIAYADASSALPCVLIASDQRLLRAAPVDVPARLAAPSPLP